MNVWTGTYKLPSGVRSDPLLRGAVQLTTGDGIKESSSFSIDPGKVGSYTVTRKSTKFTALVPRKSFFSTVTQWIKSYKK